MFQILDFKIEAKGREVIDDVLKTQYKGITGFTIWTPEYRDMRLINIELDIDGKEIFPDGFPAELFSANTFRGIDDCVLKMDFPERSKIEGVIVNDNDKPVDISLIFFVKL